MSNSRSSSYEIINRTENKQQNIWKFLIVRVMRCFCVYLFFIFIYSFIYIPHKSVHFTGQGEYTIWWPATQVKISIWYLSHYFFNLSQCQGGVGRKKVSRFGNEFERIFQTRKIEMDQRQKTHATTSNGMRWRMIEKEGQREFHKFKKLLYYTFLATLGRYTIGVCAAPPTTPWWAVALSDKIVFKKTDAPKCDKNNVHNINT